MEVKKRLFLIIHFSLVIFYFQPFSPAYSQHPVIIKADQYYDSAQFELANGIYTDWIEDYRGEINEEYFLVLSKLARTEEMLSKYDRALNHFSKALEIAISLQKSELEYIAKINLADLYRRLEQFRIAKNLLHSIPIEELKDEKYIKIVSRTYHRLAAVSSENGLTDSAIYYSQKSLAISEPMEISDYMADSYNELGFVYENLNQYDSSLYYYKKAIAIWEEDENQRYYSNGFSNLSRLYNTMNLPDSSIFYLSKLIGEIGEKTWPAVKAEIYHTLMTSYKMVGDSAKADAMYQIYLEEQIKYLESEAIRQFLHLQSEHDLIKKENDHELALLEIETSQNREKFLLIVLFLLVSGGLIFGLAYTKIKKKNSELDDKNLAIRNHQAKLQGQNEILEKLVNTNSMLFSIISHDLRSPINSLTGLMNILLNHMDKLSKDEIQEFGGRILKSVDNINYLLDNLLSWARTKSGNLKLEPSVFSFNELAKENIDFLQEAALQKEIKSNSILEEDFTVFADYNCINTVIRNLLNNAIKFTPRSGVITLKAKNQNQELLVVISDTGIGMPEEKAKNLFSGAINNSTSGTNGEKGTGIGLMLCQELVRQNGGEIWVESKDGGGSQFYFTMPLAE